MSRYRKNVTTSTKKTLAEDFRATRFNVAIEIEKIRPTEAMSEHQKVSHKQCRDIRAKMYEQRHQ